MFFPFSVICAQLTASRALSIPLRTERANISALVCNCYAQAASWRCINQVAVCAALFLLSREAGDPSQRAANCFLVACAAYMKYALSQLAAF